MCEDQVPKVPQKSVSLSLLTQATCRKTPIPRKNISEIKHTCIRRRGSKAKGLRVKIAAVEILGLAEVMHSVSWHSADVYTHTQKCIYCHNCCHCMVFEQWVMGCLFVCHSKRMYRVIKGKKWNAFSIPDPELWPDMSQNNTFFKKKKKAYSLFLFCMKKKLARQ